MNDSKKVSRRDWFRLRIPRENQMLSSVEDKPKTGDTLRPVELPPNHDGMDLSQLPPMREANLTQEQVNALFQDIESLATDIQLMQRARQSNRASAANVSSKEQLQLAHSALLSGSVPRIQIRYRWQDSLWIDTLSSSGGEFELVRIAHRGM